MVTIIYDLPIFFLKIELFIVKRMGWILKKYGGKVYKYYVVKILVDILVKQRKSAQWLNSLAEESAFSIKCLKLILHYTPISYDINLLKGFCFQICRWFFIRLVVLE